MTPATDPSSPAQRARDLAWAAVQDRLPADRTYAWSVDDQPRQWVFRFLPEHGVRGGGAQVTVDKASRAVTGVTFLQ